MVNFQGKALLLSMLRSCAMSPRYREEIVPLHPCLRLVSNCEQTLSSHTSRRLITMEKMKEVEVREVAGVRACGRDIVDVQVPMSVSS